MKLEQVTDWLGMKRYILKSRTETLQVLYDDGTVEGRIHISISHQRRYPTWDEIKFVRYALGPPERDMVMYFPPMDQYVNVHENCFHLYDSPEK